VRNIPELKTYLEYNDPNVVIWRTGQPGDEYIDRTDNLYIINGKITLLEIPSFSDRVIIEGFTEVSREVYENLGRLTDNQFLVDYATGVIMFTAIHEGKSMLVKYKGRGLIMLAASRVYAMVSRQPDIVITLQDLIDQANDRLNQISIKINEAQIAINNANIAASNANVAADHATDAAIRAEDAAELAEEAAESTLIIYQEPVKTYADITTAYPSPENGWRVMIESTGDIYRYSSYYNDWKKIDNWTGGALPFVSETTSGLLRNNDYSNFITRSITFSIPSIYQIGIQNHIIQFPYDGTITDIKIYCIEPPTANVFDIQVEKISQTNFDNGDIWTPLLNESLKIQTGDHKSQTANLNNAAKVITKNTYFRLNVSAVDATMKAIGIQINIKTHT
jgi:hypothetical protein